MSPSCPACGSSGNCSISSSKVCIKCERLMKVFVFTLFRKYLTSVGFPTVIICKGGIARCHRCTFLDLSKDKIDFNRCDWCNCLVKRPNGTPAHDYSFTKDMAVVATFGFLTMVDNNENTDGPLRHVLNKHAISIVNFLKGIHDYMCHAVMFFMDVFDSDPTVGWFVSVARKNRFRTEKSMKKTEKYRAKKARQAVRRMARC